MRILAQVRKELRQLTRDRLAVALALLLPLIQLTLMGQSLAFIVRDLPLVVQDFDDSTRLARTDRHVPCLADVSHYFLAARPEPRRGLCRQLGPRRPRDPARLRPRSGARPRRARPVAGGRIRRQHGQAPRRLCRRRHALLQRGAPDWKRASAARADGYSLLVQPVAVVEAVLWPGYLRDGAVDVSAAARDAGDGPRRASGRRSCRSTSRISPPSSSCSARSSRS